MRKHTLRYCFVLLALATTGLFAQSPTEPVQTAATGHHKSVKTGKVGKTGKKGRKAPHTKSARPEKQGQKKAAN